MINRIIKKITIFICGFLILGMILFNGIFQVKAEVSWWNLMGSSLYGDEQVLNSAILESDSEVYDKAYMYTNNIYCNMNGFESYDIYDYKNSIDYQSFDQPLFTSNVKYTENANYENMGGTAFRNQIKITIYDDDPIVGFIPKEFFVKRGTYRYIGDKYSFLVIDPQNMLPYSNEITINNGQFGSTIITKGFTRNLFILMNGSYQSRLEFTFTSSNQHVAMVSIYGTIQGIKKGTALIIVKNKVDPNIVSYVLITVVDLPQPPIIHTLTITLDNNSEPLLNGTEYNVLGNTNPITFNIIHKYYTRSICIAGGPSPIRQDYSFYSSDYNIAAVDCWGFIHGVNPGIATITIINKYAPNFIGYVEVEIVI